MVKAGSIMADNMGAKGRIITAGKEANMAVKEGISAAKAGISAAKVGFSVAKRDNMSDKADSTAHTECTTVSRAQATERPDPSSHCREHNSATIA